jgi:hypothetical protein
MKFAKYEAPFGVAYGHSRWSREGKNLAVLSSISESQTITTWSVEIFYHRNAEIRDREIKTLFSARSQPVGI